MKYLLPLLLLSGCGVSYQFQPFAKDAQFSKEEIAAAFQQRDKAIEGLLKKVEALEKSKK